jgi:acyl carrier protein
MSQLACSTEDVLGQLLSEVHALDPDAPLDGVIMGTALASLALDSMTVIAAIAELERTYAIRIPNERLSGLELVGELVGLVVEYASIPAPEATGFGEQCQCC